MEVSKLNSQSYSPENTITAQSALTLLAEASKYGIVDIEGVLKEIEMKIKKLLSNIPMPSHRVLMDGGIHT